MSRCAGGDRGRLYLPLPYGFVQWFRHITKPHSQADLEEWNRRMLSRGPTTPEKQASFNRYRDAVDPSRTDLTSWSDLQDLEEGRTVPRRD